MIAALLAALILLPNAQAAKWETNDPDCMAKLNGICRPTHDVAGPLNERFSAFMKEYRAFRKHQEREATFRQAASDNPTSVLNLDLWQKSYSGLRDEQAQLNIKAGTLLKDIAAAYKVPIDFTKDETITAGHFRDVTTRFDPKFAFDDSYITRRKTAEGRELTWARDYGNSRASATTTPTGEVVFRMKAFEQAAEHGTDALGILASQVYHESVHFKEVIQDPTIKTERSELHAYKAVADIQNVIFALPREIQEYNKDRVTEFAEKIDKDHRAKFRYSIGSWLPRWPGTGPDLLTTFHPGDQRWEELAEEASRLEAPLKRINDDRAELRRRILLEKTERGDYEGRVARQREAVFGKPQPPVPQTPHDYSSRGSESNPCPGTLPCIPTPRVQPRYPAVPAPTLPAQPVVPVLPATAIRAAPPVDRRQDGEQALIDLSNRACSGSGALSQSEFDELWARVHKAPISANSRDRYGLRGCAWTIYGDLSRYSQMDDLSHLSIDWLNKRVGEIQAPVTTTDHVPDSPPPPDRPRCRWAGDWCK